MPKGKQGKRITIKEDGTNITVVANTSSQLRVAVEGKPSGKTDNKPRK